MNGFHECWEFVVDSMEFVEWATVVAGSNFVFVLECSGVFAEANASFFLALATSNDCG